MHKRHSSHPYRTDLAEMFQFLTRFSGTKSSVQGARPKRVAFTVPHKNSIGHPNRGRFPPDSTIASIHTLRIELLHKRREQRNSFGSC